MSRNPENKKHTAVLVREGPPDYTILSSEAFPIPDTDEAGAILEVTDTGDRYRWSGTAWFLSGGPRVQSSTLVETALAAESVIGSFEFALDGNAPRNNILDYFFFVDGTGTPVDATAGTVTLQLSPTLPLYQDVADGTFNAITARDADWIKPNGFGKAISAKITFVGITGTPTGFRGLITQTVA